MLGAITWSAGCAFSPRSVRVSVDSTRQFQTMVGWEAASQAGQEHAEFAQIQNRILDFVIDTLGINRLRVEVRSGVEHGRDYYLETRAGRLTGNAARCARFATENDDADPRTIDWDGFLFTEFDNRIETAVLPMRARLAARGERLFLNVNYVSFMGQCPRGTAYAHSDPNEYAEFVLATVLHLRTKYGLVPDAWEVILEPEHNRVWTGRHIGEAIVTTAARLREHGVVMRFIAPSNTNAARAVEYFDAMAEVPGALSLVDEFSYHRYGGDSPPVLEAIGERARRFGVRTAMLEHIGADVVELEEDLTLAQVSAWQQYIITYPGDSVGPRTGGHYIAVSRRRDGTLDVALAPRARLLRQYFRYVRAGARRVFASSTAPLAHPVAFRNSDGRWAVVVRTDAACTLEITGLPRGTYAATWTTADTAGGPVAVPAGADGMLRATIPDRGVLTVYSDRLAPNPGSP